MTSLIVPSRRVLSAELMPAAVEDAIAGVLNPEGGRTVALNRKIPLMYALELQILIEHRQARSVGLHLNGRGELGGRLCRGCGQSIGETLIDANVGHR